MANKNQNLKRIIVDFQKLTPEILTLLVDKYPDGYEEEAIITFRNAQNEIVEAVEVKTEDTLYLVKVGKRLVQAMEDFGEDDEDDDDQDNEVSVDFDEMESDDGN
jgi:hypothetical protein